MVSGYVILAIVLALILGGWAYHRLKPRKSIESYGPIALFHTQRGVSFIDKVANISPLFWKIFSTLGVIVAFILMIDVAVAMYLSAKVIITTPTAPAGAALILPGLEVMGIRIPLLGWLAGVLVLLFAHEFSHGIIARVEKIKVESVGALFIGFLPIGAFVKPDEKRLAKEKTVKQLRIFAAGSFVNIVIATIMVALLVFLVLPSATAGIEGVKLTKVEKDLPAYKAGLREGMEIIKLDSAAVKDWPAFIKMWGDNKYKAGQDVKLATAGEEFNVKLVDKGNGEGRAGIVFCGKGIEKVNYPAQFLAPFILLQPQQACQSSQTMSDTTFWLGYEILIWIAIINFGVGIVNLLPIKPLDGGLMVEAVIKRVVHAPKISGKIVTGVSLFFFLLLLVNLALPHFRTLLKILGA